MMLQPKIATFEGISVTFKRNLGHLRQRLARQTGGYIYVIEFTGGTVKVGRTKDAAQRLAQHARAADVHGAAVARHWFSERHMEFAANEKRLISFCMKHFGEPATGAESFSGADYAATVAYGETLPMEFITDSMLDRLVAGQIDTDLQHDEDFRRRRESALIAELTTEVNLIKSLANDANSEATSEAIYNVVRRLMTETPAPWRFEDPTATADFLELRAGGPRPDSVVREFEVNMRALFALTYQREAADFAEFAAFLNRYDDSGVTA